MSKLIKLAEAAQRMGLDPARVRILCRQGRVPNACRVGHCWLIPEAFVFVGTHAEPKHELIKRNFDRRVGFEKQRQVGRRLRQSTMRELMERVRSDDEFAATAANVAIANRCAAARRLELTKEVEESAPGLAKRQRSLAQDHEHVAAYIEAALGSRTDCDQLLARTRAEYEGLEKLVWPQG